MRSHSGNFLAIFRDQRAVWMGLSWAVPHNPELILNLDEVPMGMGAPPTFSLCSKQVTWQPLLKTVHQECKCCKKWMDHSRTGGSAYINIWAGAIKVTTDLHWSLWQNVNDAWRQNEKAITDPSGNIQWHFCLPRDGQKNFLTSVSKSQCFLIRSHEFCGTSHIRRDSLAISGQAIWKISFQEEVVRYH